jgi:hypothetical protein
LANGRQLGDVEEPPPQTCGRIDVEEALAQLRVRPEAVRVIGGHVVGNHVEDQPQPRVMGRGRQPFKFLTAAQI